MPSSTGLTVQCNLDDNRYLKAIRATGAERTTLIGPYDQASKIIIDAWVNDGDIKRACGSKTDADAGSR